MPRVNSKCQTTEATKPPIWQDFKDSTIQQNLGEEYILSIMANTADHSHAPRCRQNTGPKLKIQHSSASQLQPQPATRHAPCDSRVPITTVVVNHAPILLHHDSGIHHEDAASGRKALIHPPAHSLPTTTCKLTKAVLPIDGNETYVVGRRIMWEKLCKSRETQL